MDRKVRELGYLDKEFQTFNAAKSGDFCAALNPNSSLVLYHQAIGVISPAV